MKADFWLQQPTEFLRSTFVRGLQTTDLPPSRASHLRPWPSDLRAFLARRPIPLTAGPGCTPTASGSAVSQTTVPVEWRAERFDEASDAD